METAGSRIAAALTAEHLVALHDELAALVQAGVPLDRGLRQLGQDAPGKLGRSATALARRLEAGESLSGAMASEPQLFPPFYRTLVEVGLRSGRLAVALEGITQTLQELVDLRRSLVTSLIYPTILLATAYSFLIAALVYLPPLWIDTFDRFEFELDPGMRVLRELGSTAWVWGPALPLLLLGSAVLLPRLAPEAGSGSAWTDRLRPFSRLRYLHGVANFAQILALLIDQRVPLAEALALSGGASGHERLARRTEQLAAELRRGERDRAGGSLLPPFMAWLIFSTPDSVQLTDSLREIARAYRQQAVRLGEWIVLYLPLLLSVGLAGSMVLLYALLVLAPWFQLLFRITLP